MLSPKTPVISLQLLAASVGEPSEHPLARRVWYVLAMARWRVDWRAAEAAGDFAAMDRLDPQYERIQGI